MKKIIYSLALMMGMMTFAACSSDSNDNNDNVDKYKDRSYGTAAIDACGDVVNQFEAANKVIAQANLTAEQEEYLRQVLTGLVSNVIIPTYTNLANDVEDLEKTLNGLTVNTITQAQIDQGCTTELGTIGGFPYGCCQRFRHRPHHRFLAFEPYAVAELFQQRHGRRDA